MAKITIDNTEYDTDTLSDEAKNAIGALQFVEVEIQRLQATLAAMQTARMVYGNGLKQALEKAPQPNKQQPYEFSSETIQFS